MTGSNSGTAALSSSSTHTKKDADYVFYELTRSICSECRRLIDAKIVLRDNKVFMRKRCPECGPFEALVCADAEAYTHFGKFNKPGTIPPRLRYRDQERISLRLWPLFGSSAAYLPRHN